MYNNINDINNIRNVQMINYTVHGNMYRCENTNMAILIHCQYYYIKAPSLTRPAKASLCFTHEPFRFHEPP